MPLSVLVASWAGFAIARLPRRSRVASWSGCASIVLMMPATSLLVGRVSVFRWLGLTDTPIPLMAPALLGTSPLFVLLYAWTTSRLPNDLFDLARERGLSPVATWWRVAMPLQRGTTAAVASLAFVLTWGNFLDPLIYLYDERWFTLPLGMRSLAIVPVTDQPLMLAAAVFACAARRARVRVRAPPPVLRSRAGGLPVKSSSTDRRCCRRVSAVLAACTSGDDDASPAAGEPTTVSVWVSGDPEETQAFVDVAEGVRGGAGRDRGRPRRRSPSATT